MTFREATDLLGLPHDALARELGVSVQRVRQCRLDAGSAGYRHPPPGWESVVGRLLRERSAALAEAADRLTKAEDY